MHTSILVVSVGPPSADVCRTAASFPYVDHPRFIELREEEVKGYPSQATLQLRYKKSLVSPAHPIHLSDV
jgi:hypothetical protein